MVKRPKRPRDRNQPGKSASGAAAQDGDMPVLTDPDGQFARNDNRPPFQFRHGFKDPPLFELPNPIALAKRPLHVEAYWSNGKVEPTDSGGIDRLGSIPADTPWERDRRGCRIEPHLIPRC
ncbi:MAG: hypothetical protein M3178_11375 [Pseudomonadota bacterium]|nr:hypothetical protein [Pseudomonadota bacterium]